MGFHTIPLLIPTVLGLRYFSYWYDNTGRCGLNVMYKVVVRCEHQGSPAWCSSISHPFTLSSPRDPRASSITLSYARQPVALPGASSFVIAPRLTTTTNPRLTQALRSA